MAGSNRKQNPQKNQNQKNQSANQSQKMLNYKYKEPPETQQTASRIDFRFHKVTTSNILVVGATGSGKSTFVNVLRNPQYITDFSVDSVTREATSQSNLLEIEGQYHYLNIIDTPGFGDSSQESKSDLELEEMILKFVKKDITQLNLVLLTVKYGVRYESGQIETMMNVLRFLGPEMKKNTAILCTFAENASIESKKNWLQKAQNSNLNKIFRYCTSKKVFFTGMCLKTTEIDKITFENEIRKQHFRIIDYSIKSTPIQITGEEHDKVANKFKVYESAAKDSLTLKNLLPEIKKIVSELSEKKVKLVDEYDSDYRVAEFVEKYKDINEQQINEQVLEWSKLQTAIEKYVQEGGHVSEAAKEIKEQYKLIRGAEREATHLLDELNIFEDSDINNEEEFDIGF